MKQIIELAARVFCACFAFGAAYYMASVGDIGNAVPVTIAGAALLVINFFPE